MFIPLNMEAYMYKEKVRAYGEDLIDEADLTKTTTGENTVKCGGTLGALAVNLVALTDVTVVGQTSLELKTADNTSDEFEYLASVAVPVKSYAKGDIMVSYIVGQEALKLVKANVVGNTSNSGSACVTLEYLAR